MNESIKAPEGIPTGAITEGERMSTDTRSAEERRKECRQRHKVQYFMTAADYLFWSDWERCNLEDRFQKPDPVLMAMTQEGADGVHDTTEGAFPEDGIELELSPAASQVLKGAYYKWEDVRTLLPALSPDMALPYLIPAGEQPEGLRNIRIDMIMGELREAFTAGYVREGAAHPDVLRRAPRDFLLNAHPWLTEKGPDRKFCPWLDFSRAGSCKTARAKWEQAGRAWFRRCYPSGTTTGYEYQEGKPYQEPAPPRNP